MNYEKLLKLSGLATKNPTWERLNNNMNKLKEAAKIMSGAGAKKGGIARAKKLSPERRKEIAKKAIEARWGKKG